MALSIAVMERMAGCASFNISVMTVALGLPAARAKSPRTSKRSSGTVSMIRGEVLGISYSVLSGVRMHDFSTDDKPSEVR